ncbi:MAG: DUF2157 domain-containing protein [Flavobacterium sp.]|uniref:DUF2157 domain-containing protein n=1 Tax=Flavobacterium sp. TaxID=239 RepID=UPI0011FAFE98|nr:DUF2157 domain-containing protein [Flavobacterium sp.]RZJ68226.1 MAG: DUF2157 domain-containing protein [Flavobacterium sp.]
MSIHDKDLRELESAGVISSDVAQNIASYYRNKSNSSPNRLFTIFAILGELLIGLGIILILAHNWDDFPKMVRVTLAFVPIVLGQALCTYSLLKQTQSTAWRESSSTFLTIGIGAAIALIAQIYNMPSDFKGFMFTWSALALPLVYVMRSNMTSLLYLIGITVYATSSGYGYPSETPWWYLLLLAAIVPNYWLLVKNRFGSNFTAWHHWFLCASTLISLGTFARSHEEYMFIAYVNLLAIFYLIGNLDIFSDKRLFSNAWLFLGSLGTVCILMPLTFSWFWTDMQRRGIEPTLFKSPEFIAALVLGIAALALFIRHRRAKSIFDITPIEPVFIVFAITFFIGYRVPQAYIIINIIVFTIGLLTIRRGAQQDHLGILNYGLLIITILVACRFFDTNLTFVVRGLLFIGVGVGFIVANSKLLKKRRTHEN